MLLTNFMKAQISFEDGFPSGGEITTTYINGMGQRVVEAYAYTNFRSLKTEYDERILEGLEQTGNITAIFTNPFDRKLIKQQVYVSGRGASKKEKKVRREINATLMLIELEDLQKRAVRV